MLAINSTVQREPQQEDEPSAEELADGERMIEIVYDKMITLEYRVSYPMAHQALRTPRRMAWQTRIHNISTQIESASGNAIVLVILNGQLTDIENEIEAEAVRADELWEQAIARYGQALQELDANSDPESGLAD